MNRQVEMPAPALLPCPFCGDSVRFERTAPSYFGGSDFWGIICRSTKNRGGTCALSITPQRTREAAAERWNRRAPFDTPAYAAALNAQVIEAHQAVSATLDTLQRLLAGHPLDIGSGLQDLYHTLRTANPWL